MARSSVHRIAPPKDRIDPYEREIAIRATDDGHVNVAIQLFGDGGPIIAGLSLTVEETGHLIVGIARALADAAPPAPYPEER